MTQTADTAAPILPDDIEGLRALLLATLAERDELATQNDRLRHLLLKLKRLQFGTKSERLPDEQMQLALEDLEQAIATGEAQAEKRDPELRRDRAAKRRANRGALPAHLPRIEITLEPEDTTCPCCRAAMAGRRDRGPGARSGPRQDEARLFLGGAGQGSGGVAAGMPAEGVARDDRPWGGADPPAIVYTYAPGRGEKHASKLLGGYRGILQCDGYTAYKQVAGSKSAEGGITLAFCWSHVRRGFYDQAKTKTAPIATEALERIAALYRIEGEIRGKSAEVRQAVRDERSRPLVEAMRQWLDAQLPKLARGGRPPTASCATVRSLEPTERETARHEH